MRLKLMSSLTLLLVTINIGQGAFASNVPPIDMGASVGVNNEMYEHPDTTPLHEAVAAGNLDAVRALLARRANPNILNSYAETPLGVALRHGMIEIVEALLEGGAYSDYTDSPTIPTPLAEFLSGRYADFGDETILVRNMLFAARRPV